MPPRPDRVRRSAIPRSRPPFQWHQERAGNAPNSETELPSHATRLRGKGRIKRKPAAQVWLGRWHDGERGGTGILTERE
jgi:hypothetical protein